MALQILYPNGEVMACQMYIWDVGTLSPVVWDGSVNVGPITIGSVDQGAAGTDPWLVELSGSSTVSVDNFPATQPVSIAAPVAVTGPLTDAQLRATPIPISESDTTATGTLDTTPGGSVPISTNGTGVVVFWFSGVGNGQSFIVKGTQDSGVITNETLTVFNASGQSVSAFNPSTQYYVPVFGQQQILITGQTDGSGTGTATIRLRASSTLFLKEFQFSTTSTTPLLQTTIPASAATIAKAEDVASVNGDVGVPAMAIRQSSPANTSNANGDYEILQISAGRLWASATIDAALPAGTNVIGHVIADSGSTTVVTGNVTVVQPTGTNLHIVVDSGTITTVSTVTAVTAITNALPAGNNNIGDVDVASVAGNVTVVQPTGTNLHTVIDSGSTVVTQPTGTNLHVVTDSGTITTVSTVTNVTTVGTITNPVTVQATDLDIRNLVFATDKVDVSGSTVTATVDTSLLATAAKQDTGNASLAVIDSNTDSLTTAQDSTATSTTGPMVQGKVDYIIPAPLDNTIIPLSLTSNARLRVITSVEDNESAWDQELPDSFNIIVAQSGFDLNNRMTVDTAWEN